MNARNFQRGRGVLPGSSLAEASSAILLEHVRMMLQALKKHVLSDPRLDWETG